MKIKLVKLFNEKPLKIPKNKDDRTSSMCPIAYFFLFTLLN